MEKQIKPTPYHITNDNTAITEVDGVADTWSDLFKFRVPQNVGIVISPGDTFSCYLEDASPAECARDGTCRIRIEVRDASEQHREVVMGDVIYNKLREFQDKNKVFKFNPPKPVKVSERQWIVIMAKDDAIIDVSDSYFDLLVTRIAELLG